MMPSTSMNANVKNLDLQIVRYVDDSFPGWVASEFVDSDGARHTLVDRWPIFTTDILDETSTYPRPGRAPCKVMSRYLDDRGREIARISIARPVAMESTDGLSEFTVLSSQLSD
jgi:hypothetical protein